MFKIKIIEWEKKSVSNPLIDLMINKIQFLQGNNKCLINQNTSALVITDEREQNIIGGVSLVKRDLNHLQEDLRRLIPTGLFYRNYVWECSAIYFSSFQTLSADSLPSDLLSRNFYHSLYEGLVEFGKQKGVGFVVVKLTVEAYLPTKDFGLWPYIIQFLPREQADDLFYGILPLRGCFYETYQRDWKDLERDIMQ